jgi:hypothetical protein
MSGSCKQLPLLQSNTPILKIILLHDKLFRQRLEQNYITNVAVANATAYLDNTLINKNISMYENLSHFVRRPCLKEKQGSPTLIKTCAACRLQAW